MFSQQLQASQALCAEAERMTAYSQDQCHQVPFQQLKSPNMINGEDYATCYLSLSHKSIKHPKNHESTRTRGPSVLEASGKALVEDGVIISNILRASSSEVTFSQPIDVRPDHGPASANLVLCCPALFPLPRDQRNPRQSPLLSRGPDNTKQRHHGP